MSDGLSGSRLHHDGGGEVRRSVADLQGLRHSRSRAKGRARALTAVLGVAAVGFVGCGVTIDPENQPPLAQIRAPQFDAVVSEADVVELHSLVTDGDEPNLALEYAWTSDVAGEVVSRRANVDPTGNAFFDWVHPAPGDHILTLTAWDTFGESSSASVSLVVLPNEAPTCAIVTPVPGERLTLPSTGFLTAVGNATDPETPPAALSIRWEDEAGNLLAEGNPDDEGNFAMGVQAVSGPMTLVLRVTDPLGLECVRSVAFTTNFRPSPPTIELGPDPPSIFEDLVGTILDPGTDPDGPDELLTHRWVWQRDGLEFLGPETDRVDAVELARDQVWVVEVRAVDVEGAESEPAVVTTTVPNSRPTPPVVRIEPSPASFALDLECVVVQPGTDPDPDDTLSYEFTWSVGGLPKPWVTGFTDWTETTIGDTWECKAVASDGVLESDPSNLSTADIVEGCHAGTFGGAGLVTVPDAGSLRLASGDFTVEAWVRVNGLGPGGSTAIVNKRSTGVQDGWFLGVCGAQDDCAGSVIWQISGDGDPVLLSPAPLTFGAWHHVAVTFDAPSSWAWVYIDGLLVTDGPMPAPDPTTTAPLVIADDSLGFGATHHIGTIDDVRISTTNRYPDGTTFVPDRTLYADGNTLAMWGFEEGAGPDVHDLTMNGHDGIAIGMGWTSVSSCTIDRAPNQPALQITPIDPAEGEELTCEVVAPSLDPEGNVVTYPGEWRKNGAVWTTFSDLPHTLPAADNDGTDEWTCEASGFDGALSSDPAIEVDWSGTETICTLTVADPSAVASQSCTFTAVTDGQLRMTMDNPDGSADGVFLVDDGVAPPITVYTGTRAGGFGGQTVVAWVTHDVEVNVATGPVNLTVDYDPLPGVGNTGVDTLTIEYVPGVWLEPSAGGYIGTATVGPTDTASVSLGTVTIPTDGRLMFQSMQCGTGGGEQAIHADLDGLPGNDDVGVVPTGDPGQCTATNGVRTQSIDPGTYDFSVVLQDDVLLNNGGTRSVDVYWYQP